MRPSVLEEPFGTGRGILDAIDWLQSSALSYPSVNFRDEGYTWKLQELNNIAEDAVSRFEEFRTVFGRDREITEHALSAVGELHAESSTKPGVHWRYVLGRIPAMIHREVQGLRFRMQSTSLYDLSDPPNILALEGAGIQVFPPLREWHLATVAALACAVRAIDHLSRIIEFWRGSFRNRRRGSAPLHFDGNYGDGEWEDALLKLREDASNLLHETEKRRDAFAWIERANGWLEHASYIKAMQGKAEDTAQRAAKDAAARATSEAQQQERKKRSAAARGSLQSRIDKKKKTSARIDAAWKALQSSQRGKGGVAIVAKKVSVSPKQARRYLRELGHLM
jgi:hypothetical protein